MAPDLLSVVIEVRPRDRIELGRESTAEVLHGVFHDANPADAGRLHEGNQHRPFTISPLARAKRADRFQLPAVLQPEETYWFRLSGLNTFGAECVSRFCSALAGGFEAFEKTLDVVCVRHGGHPWAGAESSRELLGRFLDDLQLPSRRLGLYFATPTAIQPRSPREPASGLFPEPGIIFPNLASKWVKLAPELSAERASLVMAAATHAGATLKVSRYKLQTQPHYLRASKPAAKRGYVGAIEFVAPSGADEKLLRALHFLCAYAFYAGIGAHTAMGMGQARPLTPQPLR